MKWLLVSAMVAATVASDLLQSYDMKRAGAQSVGSVFKLVLRRTYLILSILCLAVSFFAFMTLVSEADLSFAVPASAASFVFETVLARLVLMERVDAKRWVGAALVAGGVALLAV